VRYRVDSLNQCVTDEVLRQSVRGFYEVDRIVFALLLALNVDLHAANITRHELDTFVKCKSAALTGTKWLSAKYVVK